MESTFKPELWHDLFIMLGTAAGSLVGLLFIVMSLHIDRISKRADINMRATLTGPIITPSTCCWFWLKRRWF